MKNNFKIHRIVLKVLLWLVIISAVGFLVFVGLQISGKNRLYKKSANKRPDLSVASVTWEEDETTEEGEGSEQTSASVPVLQTEDEGDNWEEGDLRYKGVHYRYNDEMLTFLFMGIDKKKGTVKEAKNGIDGGQSDAMFLMALNPKTKEATLININRDTMTDIDVYTETGVFLATMKRQITLQHGYGDGKEISCERSVSAVSKLFYNLPIHGYCAINLEAVPKINDAVGGVDVVALEDIKEGSKTIFKEGQKVHLSGKFATLYVQSRDDSFRNAGSRAERQKQSVVAYADAARAAMKKNVTVLVDLFKTISKYMVTDITVDEVSYFSTQVADYKFDGSRMYSLQGETKMGEEHEEFYADEKALFELILKVYYDVIDD